LLPLLLGTLLSVAVMVWLDSPFNFANVIALPLLLGVGVDSGIHMLARARLMDASKTLVSSSTGRGVVISALTTTVSFGNLAFSPHPGTASMGLLLTIGMVAIVAATLLLLPAMVHLMDRSRFAGLH
jgi:predicted RND superfamily exporter protein